MSDEAENAEGVLSGEDVTGQHAPALLSRRVSAQQLAVLLGCSRNTVDAHLADGAPFIQRADVATGTKWVIDVAAYVKWLVAREKAKAKGGTDEDVDWDAMAALNTPRALEYRQQLAKTVTAEYARAETERSLARIQPLIDLMAADRAAVSNRLMGVGRQTVEKDLADLPKDLLMRIEEAFNKRQREALASLKEGDDLMETAIALADA